MAETAHWKKPSICLGKRGISTVCWPPCFWALRVVGRIHGSLHRPRKLDICLTPRCLPPAPRSWIVGSEMLVLARFENGLYWVPSLDGRPAFSRMSLI
jgi:hypothetical protein